MIFFSGGGLALSIAGDPHRQVIPIVGPASVTVANPETNSELTLYEVLRELRREYFIEG